MLCRWIGEVDAHLSSRDNSAGHVNTSAAPASVPLWCKPATVVIREVKYLRMNLCGKRKSWVTTLLELCGILREGEYSPTSCSCSATIIVMFCFYTMGLLVFTQKCVTWPNFVTQVSGLADHRWSQARCTKDDGITCEDSDISQAKNINCGRHWQETENNLNTSSSLVPQ